MVSTYFDNMKEEEKDEHEKDILKLIKEDVKRTLHDTQLYRHETIKAILVRVLFIWNIRHPASGYV